ncbi:MAG: 16S rRNA (guanine(527)-N(7))-methyltransferase RsmG [Atopobiaceae bacterium]|nr:16S rRNA (guanine(527)-N(7))-methyltransferase RsmG [Atopobiaceae bacterium]
MELDARAQLTSEASTFGIELDDAQTNLLLAHLDLVIEKNKVLNLTRIVDRSDAVTKHLVDSLLFCVALDKADCPRGAFLDLGTGAGFPGIPFGIVTQRPGLLIDSVGKKVAAVQEFIDALGLSDKLSSRAVRVEVLGKEQRGQFSCVTARAVAELNVLVEYASPLLRRDGILIASKGKLSDGELSDALYAAPLCGMEYVSRETFELPHDAGHREVAVFRKVGRPQIKLPRAVGAAKHKPLAERA